ncbi:hypothetical protein BFC18_14055 [Alteromonas confluentis]|uniref:Nudix hydrolase domain-containing protein n=2 Tax=Alteromonas confluentis TaxID=1656094 RepID=A0A1E7ZAC4_9ALTE|nr:hypothetical protein BFC18_14055 [Alteromonas confluentis]
MLSANIFRFPCLMNPKPFKFCPSCSSDSFRLTENRYSCDQCDFTFFINAATAVAGILVHDGKLLFTVRGKAPGKGKLGLPGGFVDFHESLEEALIRETREELGIHVTDWKYLMSAPNIYDYADVRYHTCDGLFVAYLNEKPAFTLQASEIEAVKWLQPDKVKLQDIAFPSLRKAVKMVIDSL